MIKRSIVLSVVFLCTLHLAAAEKGLQALYTFEGSGNVVKDRSRAGAPIDLKISNIKDGRVDYKRKKTGREHSIKIIPALQVILDKYIVGKAKNAFILDVIKRYVSPLLYSGINLKDNKLYYRIKGYDNEFKFPLTKAMKEQLRDNPLGKNRTKLLKKIIVQEETKKQYRDIHDALKQSIFSLIPYSLPVILPKERV